MALRRIFSLSDVVTHAIRVRRESHPTMIRSGIIVIEHLARCELSCARDLLKNDLLYHLGVCLFKYAHMRAQHIHAKAIHTRPFYCDIQYHYIHNTCRYKANTIEPNGDACKVRLFLQRKCKYNIRDFFLREYLLSSSYIHLPLFLSSFHHCLVQVLRSFRRWLIITSGAIWWRKRACTYEVGMTMYTHAELDFLHVSCLDSH